MKCLIMMVAVSFVLSSASWETDFTKARQLAQTEHKNILLNFSGSDWCGPCIRLHSTIFESPAFTQYANDHLILVNADFPRLKKHKLTPDQQTKNDQLADLYNKEGVFPLTVLLNADGKVIKRWEGMPPVSAESFVNEVKTASDAGN